jgi:hypothetical protein
MSGVEEPASHDARVSGCDSDGSLGGSGGSLDDGVGAVGATVVATRVLMAVVDLSVDCSSALETDVELHDARMAYVNMHAYLVLLASASWCCRLYVLACLSPC